MSDLGPDARSLIDTMLEADGPTHADRARVRSKIDVRLGLAGAAGAVAASVIDKASAGAGMVAGTAGAGSAAAGGAVAGSAVAGGAVAGGAAGGAVLGSTAIAAGKVALAVAVAGASVGAGVGVYRANVSAPAEVPVAAVKVDARPVALEPPAPLPAAPAMLPPAEAPALPLAADVAVDPAPARSAAARAASETGPSVRAALPHPAREREAAARALPEADSVREEAALLAAARAAIAAGDARGALERLDEHAVRFSGGVLVEERRAVRVLALCASGKTAEARAAAAAFIADSPRSPLVSSVRGACSSEADDFVTKPRGPGHP